MHVEGGREETATADGEKGGQLAGYVVSRHVRRTGGLAYSRDAEKESRDGREEARLNNFI